MAEALARTTQGPSWGYSQVNFHQVCQLFLKNGSKNGAERGWDNPTKGLMWSKRRTNLSPPVYHALTRLPLSPPLFLSLSLSLHVSFSLSLSLYVPLSLALSLSLYI